MNAIPDGERHAAVLSVITDVLDMLLAAEIICPYHILTDCTFHPFMLALTKGCTASRPVPLELVDIFGQWLFEACHLSEYGFLLWVTY